MSITKLTRKYISDHPSIKDCLRIGLINYSALSRQICDELKLKQFDAALVACRRYGEQIKNQQLREKKILALLKNAKLQIRNKIAVAIVEKPRDFEKLSSLHNAIRQKKGDFYFIEGNEALVIVTNSDFIDEVKEAFKGRILKLSHDLAQVHLLFSEKIETTPGVVSYIYGLLADNDINVLEEMSCWTDLMIVVSEDDAAKALKVLSR